MSRVLCLGAHPDDLEAHMGGALLAFAEAGFEVLGYLCGEGEAGTLQPEAGSRADEARAAFGELGFALRIDGFPDGRLEDGPELGARLRELVEEHRPDLLFGPQALDPHPDHAALARCLDRLELEGDGPPTWRWLDAWPAVEPGHFLDLDRRLAAKRRLIGYHRSQLPGPEDPRAHLPKGQDLLERIEARDRHLGALHGRSALEPYLAPPGRRGEAPRVLADAADFL